LFTLLVCTDFLKAEDVMSKEFEVGENPKLTIDVDAAHIVVIKGVSGKIKASVEVPDKENFRVSSTQTADRVRIKLEHKGLVGILTIPLHVLTSDEVVLNIEVPEKCDIEVSADGGYVDINEIDGDIDITSSACVIDLEKVKGETWVNSSSGSLKVNDFDGKLDAEVNAGSIKLKNSKGIFSLESNTGFIDVKNSLGQFQVTSNVGSIDFEGTVAEGEDNSISSDVGSVKVRLSNQKDLDVDAETDLGDVSIFPKPANIIEGDRHTTFQIGGGGPKLRIRSDVGSISIEKGAGLKLREDEEEQTPEVTPEKPPEEPKPETPPNLKQPTGK